MDRTITYENREYELKYGVVRVEQIESATKKPLMANLVDTNGFLSLSDLKIIFAYGLKQADANAYVAPKTGMLIAEQMLVEMGYTAMTMKVMEVLQEDLPFMFQAS